MTPMNDWKERFDNKFEDMGWGKDEYGALDYPLSSPALREEIKDFIEKELLSVRREVVEECIALVDRKKCILNEEAHKKSNGQCHARVTLLDVKTSLYSLSPDNKEGDRV